MAKKICELCGMNLSSDVLFGVNLCNNCREIHSQVSHGDKVALDKITNPVFFSKSTDGAKNLFSHALKTYETFKMREKAKEDFEKNYSSLMLTTGSGFDGYTVEQYIDVFCEEIIFKNAFWNRVGAAFEDLGNTLSFKDREMTGAGELISNAREYTMQRFKEKAARLGANAVLGVEFESSFGSEIVRVAISGTAVRIAAITPSVDSSPS